MHINRLPVIVVGTGPAGCAAAHAVAGEGIAAVALERGAPGKDKVCGDAFLPSAIESLDALGISQADVHELGGTPFDSLDLVARQQRIWRVSYAPQRGWIIPRAAVDQRLRDIIASLCDVRYETVARSIEILADGVLRVRARRRRDDREISVDCSAVVLATGSSSPLPCRWGIDGVPVTAASISTYARPGSTRCAAPTFEFDAAVRPGYSWAFPADTSWNVGVCLFDGPNGSRLRALGNKYVRDRDLAADGWRGGAAALWSGRGEAWHHGAGIVSCGDAAGVVDPFTGEGISAALESGREAGMAVSRYVCTRETAYLAGYSSWLQRRFSGAYRATTSRRVWGLLCGL